MPQKALDQDLVAAIRKITDRFITFREGTPRHLAKAELGKKHNLLEEAVRDGYLQNIGPKYFPCFQALQLEDAQSRFSVEQCTTLVFKGLRAIYPDAFSVLLRNESAESVLVREIRLIGPKGIALTEPYVLPPESKRTIEPRGRLQVDWKPQSDPTVSLIRLSSPGGWPSGKSRIEADLTIEIGCEVLKRFKKCPTNRQVQVDVLNRRIDDSW